MKADRAYRRYEAADRRVMRLIPQVAYRVGIRQMIARTRLDYASRSRTRRYRTWSAAVNQEGSR